MVVLSDGFLIEARMIWSIGVIPVPPAIIDR